MVTRIKSSQITDGTVLNADVNASAAIAATKVSGLAASATTDTTNAANIGSGILPDARFPSNLPAIGGGNLTGISSAPVVYTGGGKFPNTGTGSNANKSQTTTYSLTGFTNGGKIFFNVPAHGENLNNFTITVTGSGVSGVGYQAQGTIGQTMYAWATFTGNPTGNVTINGTTTGQSYFRDGSCGWIAVGS